MQDTEHLDSCCPIDPTRKNEWLERLVKERSKLIVTKGEQLAEQQLLLKTLSHSLRLDILYYLHQKPHCVCELVKKLKASNSKVSYHLSYLAGLNLIQDKLTGGRVIYYRNKYAKAVLNWLEKIPKGEE